MLVHNLHGQQIRNCVRCAPVGYLDSSLTALNAGKDVDMSVPVDFTSLKGVEFSASAYDVDSGEVIVSHQPTRMLATASIGKLFLLYATLDMARNGELDLDERLWRRPSERVGESRLGYLLQHDPPRIFVLGIVIGGVGAKFAADR